MVINPTTIQRKQSSVINLLSFLFLIVSIISSHHLKQSMTPNRKSAKSTPSPATLRDRVLRNCLSEIRSKRSSMVQQYRTQTAETRSELMKAFVSEIYSVTKRENRQPQLTVSDEMDQQQVEDEYLQSAEHRELLSQIADAIAFELEHQQEMVSEEQLFEMDEWEESARIEMLDSDENTIICPLCRYICVYKFTSTSQDFVVQSKSTSFCRYLADSLVSVTFVPFQECRYVYIRRGWHRILSLRRSDQSAHRTEQY